VAGTPPSKILDTIKEVAVIQDQLAALTAAVEKLALRLEAIENRVVKTLPPGGSVS